MKQCRICKKWKPFTDFRKNKGHKYGLQSHCKQCAVEVDKKYRNANHEKTLESSRRWAAAHPDKVLDRLRRWQAAHPEKVREHSRKWREANPERSKEVDRKYRVKHPDKMREKDHTRRARENGNGGIITAQEWEGIKKKYNYTCLCCRRREPEIKLTLDHVIPISLGGENIIENAQPLCRSCNCRKQTKSTDYRPWWDGRLF